MKTFHCDKCSQQVFFENTLCGACGSMLGYQPEIRAVSSFEPSDNGYWRSLNPVNAGRVFKQCSNYANQHVCNWMLDLDDAHDLCASCQLTVVIPTLSSEKNHLFWQRLESAKRRLLYSLWFLGLKPVSKEENEETGLAFQFLEDESGSEKVLTGHDDGLITLNIAEADPAKREGTREQMHERYRTLLGHFRHESGHYYFDRLIADGPWVEGYRQLFGDERQDYSECLKSHYANGAPVNWEQSFISSYAASHPWEDWAETWAHYLHMIDTLETAHACGLSLNPHNVAEPGMVISASPMKIDTFEEIIKDWFALTYVLNSLNRSVGMPDSYPFTLPAPVQEKLHFIHRVVLGYAEPERQGMTQQQTQSQSQSQSQSQMIGVT
ncbi:putative zinc-binding peptidase [Undibacterium sp. 10I3]|uniref:zinc-binding metallopeptidase family protein n=1 Tax=Undibacterium sp. 10I3 TaxID=3048579 RepID=UPI002B23E5D3|nr:putative zinc-binding peptidase [Undibacterium sp. 10I3]MEB0229760.1 putative zinc-binding peptidase [Undibacterium sp. 10I3]